MLTELHVRHLGVIDDLHLVLGPGMTALTGETGAGKTLLVEAIELLVGERADATLVRKGCEEALVEGRFQVDGDEVIVARVVPTTGRSRAYLRGRLATVSELAAFGRQVIDLHGQHSHQSLLSTAVQRAALDHFGGVDLGPLEQARARLRAADDALAGLGGDQRARAREADLLRFQLDELAAAAISDAEEDRRLEAAEELLADATAHREAGRAAYHALAGDGAAIDWLAQAVGAVNGRAPLQALESRLRALAAEADDLAAELRRTVDGIVDDPAGLDEVRARRGLLRDLCRKYGEGLSQIMAYEAEARDRLAALEQHDEQVAAFERERASASADVDRAAAAVAAARRRAAPALASAVEDRLQDQAMAGARFQVEVGGPDPADDVVFQMAANAGQPPLPITKVASGGELARVMLAARLVLTEAPPALVFDEVDAGVGGRAALAVGRALSALAARHQVLVVTHLPQVAAFADQQVVVSKEERHGRALAWADAVDGDDRVAELSRMLSGMESSVARDHAEELLAAASRERGR